MGKDTVRRVADYRQRMKDAGYRRVELYLDKQEAKKVREFVAKMRGEK